MKKHKNDSPALLAFLIFLVMPFTAFSEETNNTESDHYNLTTSLPEIPGEIPLLMEYIYTNMQIFLGFEDQEKKLKVKIQNNENGETTVFLESWKDNNDSTLVLTPESDLHIVIQMAARQILYQQYPALSDELVQSISLYFQFNGNNFPKGDFGCHPALLALYSQTPPTQKVLYEASETALFIHYVFATTDREGIRLFWECLTYGTDNNERAHASEMQFRSYMKGNNRRLAFIEWLGNQPRVTERFTNALDFYNEGEYEQASAILREMQNFMDDYQIPYYLGLIAYETGELESSLLYFQEAGQLGAPEALINYSVGLVLWKAEKYEEARLRLYLSASQDPDQFSEPVGEILNY